LGWRRLSDDVGIKNNVIAGDVMGLLDTIKRAGVDAVGASGPMVIQFGVVKNADPLEIIVDQRLHLTREFLIVPESLTAYDVDLRHSHSYTGGTTGDALNDPITIRRGLETGDKLILLRMQGGQKYLILDREATA